MDFENLQVCVAVAIGPLVTALVLAVAIAPAVLAQSDTEPPVLVNFDFNPKSIDVTTGPVDVTGCIPRFVDFRRSFRADELNSIFDQPIRSVPPCDA